MNNDDIISSILREMADNKKDADDGLQKACESTFRLYKSWVDAGFTQEQAFELIKIMLAGMSRR